MQPLRGNWEAVRQFSRREAATSVQRDKGFYEGCVQSVSLIK